MSLYKRMQTSSALLNIVCRALTDYVVSAIEGSNVALSLCPNIFKETGNAVLFGTNRYASTTFATFFNAVATLSARETHSCYKIYPLDALLATAFAIGQTKKMSGIEIVKAYVEGIDTLLELTRNPIFKVHGDETYLSFFACSSASIACSLYGANETETINAFQIALAENKTIQRQNEVFRVASSISNGANAASKALLSNKALFFDCVEIKNLVHRSAQNKEKRDVESFLISVLGEANISQDKERKKNFSKRLGKCGFGELSDRWWYLLTNFEKCLPEDVIRFGLKSCEMQLLTAFQH